MVIGGGRGYRISTRLNVSQFNHAFCDLRLNHLRQILPTSNPNLAIPAEFPVIP
jgi:hypothetical protein